MHHKVTVALGGIILPRDYDADVTMTIRHPYQSDMWVRGSVHSRDAMPWSFEHPAIANVMGGHPFRFMWWKKIRRK